MDMSKPEKIPNWIGGRACAPENSQWLDKFNPHTGERIAQLADSGAKDVALAIKIATEAFPAWSGLTPIERGKILSELAVAMKVETRELADCVALEAGKPPQDALGEVSGAIQQAEYFAGEGMRLYGRTLTSGVQGKHSYTVRQPRGVAGLIVPANTPIANIAWKVLPALICGNTVVLKASEDAPQVAQLFAKLTQKAGLPDGVFNVIQGRGRPAGEALVLDERVCVVSFTGSTAVGQWIGETAGRRLARVSLELGGKNPFIVCDDADLDHAASWACLSAFSNAGQRCSAGSRIIIFSKIYEQFRDKVVSKAKSLKLGINKDCDLGPVINKCHQKNILEAIRSAKNDGGKILCGGTTPGEPSLAKGYYILPTLIEGLSVEAELSCKELFGPVATLYPAVDMQEALEIANSTQFGLTAAIHTKSLDRAMWFAYRIKAGVANINLGTFGSEPHIPFGGLGSSGNGTREPGVEALEIYSELKTISLFASQKM